MWHNSVGERLCHQQCRDTSAGPVFSVDIINNPWVVLVKNDDKWAASVSPGRENCIWSAVVASVFSMCREPGDRNRRLRRMGLCPQSDWMWYRDRPAASPGLPHPALCLCRIHPLLERKKETLLPFQPLRHSNCTKLLKISPRLCP